MGVDLERKLRARKRKRKKTEPAGKRRKIQQKTMEQHVADPPWFKPYKHRHLTREEQRNKLRREALGIGIPFVEEPA